MFVLALLAAAAAPGSIRDVMIDSPNRWTWRGVVAHGAFIEIRGITGDIQAWPSEDGRVEIGAVMEDARSADMHVAETPAGLTVCAVRTGSPGCPADAASGHGGRVDYQVRVPRGVKLVARTVNGGIRADSLSSDIQAATVNGAVIISTSGTAEASTVNGSIIAKLLKPFWRKAPSFSAVNGGISVMIPANASTGIQAETRNGRVVKKLAAFRGAATEQRLDGSVGRGACPSTRLIIRTVNGQIELKQRS